MQGRDEGRVQREHEARLNWATREGDLVREAVAWRQAERYEAEATPPEDPERLAVEELRQRCPTGFNDADFIALADSKYHARRAEGLNERDALMAAGREVADRLGIEWQEMTAEDPSTTIEEMRRARVISQGERHE